MLLVSGAALTTFRNALTINDSAGQLADSNQNLRAGTNTLVKDLMMAGRIIGPGGIPVPTGAGVAAFKRPGPTGSSLTFNLVADEDTSLNLPDIATGYQLGPTINGSRTDLVTIMTIDEFMPIWRKAARAIRARDWTAAARHYRKALRQVPGQPEVWAQYGHALREAGDAAGAEAAYRRAIALDPQIGEWHLFLGQALARQGREAEAREAYRQFERLDPDGLQRKRDELVALGHPEESVRAFWHSATGQGLADDPKAENVR